MQRHAENDQDLQRSYEPTTEQPGAFEDINDPSGPMVMTCQSQQYMSLSVGGVGAVRNHPHNSVTSRSILGTRGRVSRRSTDQ